MLIAAAADTLWYWDVVELLSVPALVALNGFFVAAEFALVSLRRTKIEEMIQRGVSGAKAVDAATVKLDRTIASTQLGITLVPRHHPFRVTPRSATKRRAPRNRWMVVELIVPNDVMKRSVIDLAERSPDRISICVADAPGGPCAPGAP